MPIPHLPLARITALHAAAVEAAVVRATRSGWYLRGAETARFEAAYAAYIGTRHCVACGNGYDALALMLRAHIELGQLQAGDEVLVPANTYIATILAITENGLTPVLVEPRADTLQIDDARIETAITPRTRAVMIVHLYGRCAYTPRIGDICRERGLLLFEDNAQAHGCQHQGRRTGSLGHAAAHSFYPTKNLGALGDAGAVTTDNDALADTVRALGNYGSARKYIFNLRGRNSRMDEVQAAVLAAKLPFLEQDNARRQAVAHAYEANITNPLITIPSALGPRPSALSNVYHLFPVLCARRDALRQHLADCGVQTDIHYPVPPHRQQCYAEWSTLSLPVTERIHREELSLPCHPALTDEEVAQVVEAANSFT